MFTDHQVIRKNSRQQFQTIRPEIIKSNKQNRRQNSLFPDDRQSAAWHSFAGIYDDIPVLDVCDYSRQLL